MRFTDIFRGSIVAAVPALWVAVGLVGVKDGRLFADPKPIRIALVGDVTPRSPESLLLEQYQRLVNNMGTMLAMQQASIADRDARIAELEARPAPYVFEPDYRPIGGVRAVVPNSTRPNKLAGGWYDRGTPWLLEEFDAIIADDMERLVVWAPGGNPGGMISASQYWTMPLTDAQFDSFADDVQAWLAAKRQTTPGLTIGVYMGNSGRDPMTLGASGVLNPYEPADRDTFFATIDPFIAAGFTEFILDTGGAIGWFTVEWDRLVRERTDGRCSVGGEAFPFDSNHGIQWALLDKCAWWILDSHPKVHKALEHDFSDLDVELHWLPHAGRHPGKPYEQTPEFAAWLTGRGWIFDGFSPDSRVIAIGAQRETQ